MIEDIDGLHDTPCDGFADLPDSHLLVEGCLQRGAGRNCQSNGVGFGRRLRRGGWKRGSCGLCQQGAREDPERESHCEITGHYALEDLST